MKKLIETYGTGKRIRALTTYMVCTSVAGFGVLFWVARRSPLPGPLTTALYITLAIVGQHLSVGFPDGNYIALADPVVYAALWSFGAPLAIVSQVSAVLIQIYTRKTAILNTFFTAGQFTLCIAAASVWPGMASRIPESHAPLAQIVLVLLTVITFESVNYLFIATAVSIDHEDPLVQVFPRLAFIQRKKTVVLSYMINIAGVLLATYMGLAGIIFVFAGVFVLWLQLQFEQELARKSLEAQTDPLTGLFNTRYLDDWLENIFPNLSVEKDTCSVIFIDVDGLKRVNDGRGHDCGNAVLVHLAVTLKSVLREEDKVIRYGGDEFILILAKTDLDKAQAIAQRIFTALAGSPLERENEQVSFGISAGIASFPRHSVLGRDLIRMADKSMYVAKKDGGNRCYTADML